MRDQTKNLRRTAAGGILWTASSQGVRQVIQVAVTAVLAWHLEPSDFGLIGMIAVAIAAVAPLNELGLGAALVQRENLERGHLVAVFCAQVIIAASLGGLLALMAPLVAWFFHNDPLVPLLRVMCLGLPLGAAAAVPQALLLRQMRFRSLAIIETVSLAMSGAIAMTMAITGWGVWSLVAQSLAGTTLTTVFVTAASRSVTRVSGGPPRWKHLRDLVSFGAPLTGYQVLNFISRNIDDILIGRYLGVEALGYYTMAYRVMMYPLQKVSDVIGRVSFPTFSSIQSDLPRLRAAYLKVVQLIAVVTFPMMASMMIVAPFFTAVLFGPNWAPAAPLIAVLALSGLVGSTSTTTGSIFLSRGRTDLMLRWEIVVSAVHAVAIVLGLSYGLMGVAVACTTVALILGPTVHLIANRLIGLEPGRFFVSLAPPAGLAVVIASLLAGLRLAWQPADAADQILFLLVGAGVGAAVMLLAAALGVPSTLREAIATAREMRPASR